MKRSFVLPPVARPWFVKQERTRLCVVFPDQREHALPLPASPEQVAQFIASLLDSMNVGRVDLIQW